MTPKSRDPISNREALFSYGFRPFFLLAFVYAFLSMAAWLSWLGFFPFAAEIIERAGRFAPHTWHAHEMLFGFGLAVIAGFFLTAVPSWTDTRPVHGAPLMGLVALWLLGRLALWADAFLPNWLVVAFDLAFVPLLFAFVVAALATRWSPRNLIFPPILALLFTANVMAHAEGLGWDDTWVATGHRLALDSMLVLIAIIGGRVIPAFTTNALRNSGDPGLQKNLPVSRKPVEILAMGSIILLLLLNVFGAPAAWSGGVAFAAAAIHSIRLAGWRSINILNRPIVWILHLGYLWLIIGLGLVGLAGFNPAFGPVAALHALTIGAIGSLSTGVMTRAGLGHTGHEIVADGPITAAYVLISLAAMLRVFGPELAPGLHSELLLVSGLSWMAAFGLLAWRFGSILTTPRRHGN